MAALLSDVGGGRVGGAGAGGAGAWAGAGGGEFVVSSCRSCVDVASWLARRRLDYVQLLVSYAQRSDHLTTLLARKLAVPVSHAFFADGAAASTSSQLGLQRYLRRDDARCSLQSVTVSHQSPHHAAPLHGTYARVPFCLVRRDYIAVIIGVMPLRHLTTRVTRAMQRVVGGVKIATPNYFDQKLTSSPATRRSVTSSEHMLQEAQLSPRDRAMRRVS